MTVYRRTTTRGKLTFLSLKEARRSADDIRKWAKHVKVTKRKSKAFGQLYIVTYTFHPYRRVA